PSRWLRSMRRAASIISARCRSSKTRCAPSAQGRMAISTATARAIRPTGSTRWSGRSLSYWWIPYLVAEFSNFIDDIPHRGKTRKRGLQYSFLFIMHVEIYNCRYYVYSVNYYLNYQARKEEQRDQSDASKR